MPRNKKSDTPLIDRIKNRIVVSDNGCWEWQGSLRNGYGSMTFEKKTHSVHKVSYIIHNGEISDGLVVCHSCDNKICCNPSHLFVGTQSVNLEDARQKDRRPTAKHGTNSKYTLGCRCDSCKLAKRQYETNRRS